MREARQRTSLFTVRWFARFKKTGATDGPGVRFGVSDSHANTDACVARIFAAEQAFPIGPRRFEHSPIIPVQSVPKSLDHF